MRITYPLEIMNHEGVFETFAQWDVDAYEILIGVPSWSNCR